MNFAFAAIADLQKLKWLSPKLTFAPIAHGPYMGDSCT